MKKLTLLLVLSVLIIGCQADLETTYNRLEKISEKYGTSFKTEMLNTSIVELDKIAPLITEIESVKIDDEASKEFIEARLDMLRSQLYWELALKVGPTGFASDGFKCNDHKEMLRVSDYLNKSRYHGMEATKQLDEILIDYPEHRNIIGIDNESTNFYYSPFGWMKQQIRYNEDLFKQHCLDPFKPKKETNQTEQ